MKHVMFVLFVFTFIGITGCRQSDPPADVPQKEGSAGFGTFSQGYRMGQLSKFSVKGALNKSGEGQLLMGREGTPYQIKGNDTDGNETVKIINPWYFSSTESMADTINEYAGEYVWVSYNQAHIKNALKYDTDYLLTDIQPVTREYPTGTCATTEPSGAKSDGFRVGRITKISKKGKVAKSFEAIIQVGNSGNQFKHMSVSSIKMFNCTVAFLKAGKKVKIFYNESFFHNPLGQGTSYKVWKIVPLEDI